VPYLKCDILISKIAFKCNLYRYSEEKEWELEQIEKQKAAAEAAVDEDEELVIEVGLSSVQSIQLTHSLKGAWFQPLSL
jgi:hypothetical protein